MPDPEIPHQEYVSADVALPPEMLASMSRRRAAHQEALRERWAAKMLLRPTAEEIALRRKMRDTLSAMVAPRETIDRMNAGRRQRFQEAKAIYRQLDLPRPILDAACSRYKALRIWNADPILPRVSYDRLRDSLVSGGFVSPGTPFETAVDNSLAEEVLRA